MPKLLAFTLLLLIGCNDKLERDFFSRYSRHDRITRLRQYSLEDQYKIFRYGNDKMQPRDWTLADPIAEKGASVLPFLTAKLNSNADDLTVYDVLIILWEMDRLKTFQPAQDTTLMHFLEERVPQIKNPDLQYRSRSMLDDIKAAHHTSRQNHLPPGLIDVFFYTAGRYGNLLNKNAIVRSTYPDPA